MRVDGMLERIHDMRARLGLPTPCPDCSDPRRSYYCPRCVRALAAYLDVSEGYALVTFGLKRGKTGPEVV